MILTLERKWKKSNYTIGNLYIDGKYFCDTLEDADRGLKDTMSLEEIKTLKQPSITAIPIGTYKITLDVVSPKFSQYPFYKNINGGRVPRLLNVKGFDGILLHVMDGKKGAKLSSGCIGVGKNLIKGGLLLGKEYYKKLYDTLLPYKDNITIKIM